MTLNQEDAPNNTGDLPPLFPGQALRHADVNDFSRHRMVIVTPATEIFG
jgi:hypothetical protein